ncbi:hypothetical protein BDV32DRAFT_127402 [Aspergillus pseudonomiae]|uniref:Uncharacterized protein n=1 Tax=Aspergillus pseudonomiae TaxID=1506151 RepID=A0A5N6HUY7_9EURO|nr:uncharacterized protein BDV37DRAFT_256612 [Aspergillus pseudonomiae]KAB8257439.1 hypothetical protein BDV32DRAFT_127402 [Aspergillus pseudonomiae]KAE8400871.1 hypothetical protein BDV37DRAFT_256612 [Aspergillus pseudonomiae]
MSASDNAFQELARIFTTRNNRILEIEILPPALGPLLQDECSVGITKKYLVQAFVTARRIFFGKSSSKFEYGTPRTPHENENESVPHGSSHAILEDLLVSTEIILLFDCEHLTACNWRRGRLDALKRHHDLSSDDPGPLLQALETELTLMTTYICSPLHRHTKSPTLWQHRLWVLSRLLETRGMGARRPPFVSPSETNKHQESKVDLLKSELDIVFRAGELHPRNYYAFNYIRQVVGVLSNATKGQEGPSALAESILDSTLSWCLAHPSDISGWMFMLYLLEAVPRADLQLNTVQRVVRYALDVGWEGESLWTFVDLSVKALDLEETVINTLQRVTGISYTPIVTVPDDSMKNTALPVQSWKSWLTMARKYWDGYNQVGYNEP